MYFLCDNQNQWRIQDFPQRGAPTPKIAIIFQIFAKNCMKMKEFGPPRGARVPGAPLRSANENWLTINTTEMFTIIIQNLCNSLLNWQD